MPVEKEKSHLGKYKFQFGSGVGQDPGSRGRASGEGLGLSSWIFQLVKKNFVLAQRTLEAFLQAWVTREKSVVQFDFTKHHRFSPGTPVSSCSNTGPMWGGPYWTSRENSLAIAHRVIKFK